MSTQYQHIEEFDRFLNQEMSVAESSAFEQKLESDPSLKSEFSDYQIFNTALVDHELSLVHEDLNKYNPYKTSNPSRSFQAAWLVAGSFAMLSALLVLFNMDVQESESVPHKDATANTVQNESYTLPEESTISSSNEEAPLQWSSSRADAEKEHDISKMVKSSSDGTDAPVFSNESAQSSDVDLDLLEGLSKKSNQTPQGGNEISFKFDKIHTCDHNADGKITVNTMKGDAPDYYSLDGENFQESNVFDNLAPKVYSIYAKYEGKKAIVISDQVEILVREKCK